MKTSCLILIGALALGAHASMSNAQDNSSAPPRGPRPPMALPPLVLALDANRDGVIDATEIANALAALKTLDKNSDGQLTADEYRPPCNLPPPPPREGENGTNTESHLPPPPPDASSSPPDHRPPPPPSDPLASALDVNHDGVIDAGEIANAPTALEELDANGDGKLTPDEFHPSFPGGQPPSRAATF